jgi:low temperature requirement protein LtrA
MELFFDLVYVFAFTQLSELLYEHLTFIGALETTVVFLALWWGWNQTAWTTDWVDPERTPVLILLSVLMVLSLVMSASILRAFGSRGGTFAITFVAMQLLRVGFMAWVFGASHPLGRNYMQMFVWVAIAGIGWVVGGIVDDPHTRLAIWIGALAVEYGMPLSGYRLPGVAPVPVQTWTLAGAHLAERCQLVLMVAFGETMLRIGEALTKEGLTFTVIVAFVIGFGLIFGLWTIYYLHHAERGAETLVRSGRGAVRLAGFVFTYAHAVMVGAVIAVAVAVHMAIEEPNAPVSTGFSVICLGGPALYLVGIAMSKRWLGHGRSQPPALGAAALLVLGIPAAFGDRLSELIAAALVVAAMSMLSVRDYGREPVV